ncbi:MAG: autotransporter-associated beta strand repeat-containing protein [Planctomycetales bacterium]|nr:autotransporter-associated beta strand repeat-containing protein [Planctomycetales bacterium]
MSVISERAEPSAARKANKNNCLLFRLLPACAATFLFASGSIAQAQTWNGVSGNWADGINWSGGIAPVSSPTLQLTFGGTGSTLYDAVQDIVVSPAEFTLNGLILDSSSIATNTISGGPLRFEGTLPSIVQNGSGAFNISNPLAIRSGGLIFSGDLDGTGLVSLSGSLVGQTLITKTSLGNLDITNNADSTFYGALLIQAGALRMLGTTNSTSTATFRYSPVTLAGGASLLYAGTGTTTSSTSGVSLRFGELNGGGTINATNATSTMGGLAITAFAPGSSSATITAGANGFYFRGISTQSLTGDTSAIAGTWTLGGGYVGAGNYAATLTLSGPASRIAAGALNFRGGSLVLDNSVNDVNRIDETLVTVNTLHSGGKISLIGGSAGSFEQVASLNFSTGGGSFHASVTASAGSTNPTVLQFLNVAGSNLRGGSLATSFNFSGIDLTGSGKKLGDVGISPRILFSGAPLIGVGNMLAGTSGGVTVGFAVVNGTAWAGYDATVDTSTSSQYVRGVIPLDSTSTDINSITANSLVNLTGTAALTAARTIASLRMEPTATASLDLAGRNLLTTAYLLVGPNEYRIFNSSTTTPANISNGNTMRYFWVTDPNGTLRIGDNVNIPGAGSGFNKVGDGWLVVDDYNSANRFNFTTTTREITLQQGVMRISLTSLGGGASSGGAFSTMNFRGGTLEISGGGTLSRIIDTAGSAAGGGFYFDNAGNTGGGPAAFSAVNGDLVVTLLQSVGPDTPALLTWNNGVWVPEGYGLIFGSARSTSTVTLTNNLALDSGTGAATYREIRVLGDGQMSTRAVLSGSITGSYTTDILKTGPGILELNNSTATASDFDGAVIIAEGTVLMSNTSGPSGSAGAVIVGNRSGTADAAMYANAALSTSTPRYFVPAGSSGTSTVGGAPGYSGAATFGNVFDIQKNMIVTAGGTSFPASSITFSGTFFGTGGLIKRGVGTVSITGANSLTGDSTVEAGTLRLTNALSLGPSASVTLAGGTLELGPTSATVFPNAVIVSGAATIISNRNNSNGSAYTHTIPSLTIGSQTLAIQAGSFVTSGTATILVSGSSAIVGNATFDVGTSARLTFAGPVSDGGTSRTFAKNGPGILLLSAANNTTLTATGTSWQVNAGVLQVTNAQALGSTGTLILNAGRLDVANNSSLTFNANITVVGAASITANRTTSGSSSTQTLGTLSVGTQTVTFGPGELVTSATLNLGTISLTGDTTFFVNDNTTVVLNSGTVTGGISDGGTTRLFTKSGGGRLALFADNSGSITGNNTTWQLNAGILQSSSVTRFGNSTVDVRFSGGTWNLTGNSAVPSAARAFEFQAGGGTIDIDSAGALSITNAGQFFGSGSFTKAGLGSMSLTAAQSGLVGPIFINAGSLSISNASALGVPSSSTPITLAGGTLELINNSISLPATRPVVVGGSGSGSTIDVASGLTLTVAGGFSGVGAFNKTGEGRLVLSGSSAGVYTGAANVSAGTLAVNQGLDITGGGSITVATTGVLQGSGTIIGSASDVVTINGVISPGNSVGTLMVSGASNIWNAGSSVYFEFKTPGTSDAAAGSDWDYLNLTGSTLALTGPIALRIDALQADGVTHATLSSQNPFDPVAGNYHMLFVRTAGVSGFAADTFQVQGNVEGFGVFGTGNAFTPAAGQFWVSLEGNDLYINYAAVPEPSSLLMLGGACCGGFVLRRRRHKLAAVEHEAQAAAFA